MSATRLNIGLIGLGRLGQVYARDLSSRIACTRLVAVADVDRAAVDATVQEYGVPGYTDLGGLLASTGAKFTLLAFSRGDETEADVVGMDLAARAGYDPRAGIALWQKMSALGKNQPPQWLSTHPSHGQRVEEIRKNLGATMPLYAKAVDKPLSALPPYRSTGGIEVR